jgi:Flp pilus assembly protein TadD
MVAAVESLKELVADAPAYWQGAWLLGKAQETLGDVEGAMATFRAAHAKHPAAEPIAKDFSMLLLERNQVEEADAVNRTICAAHPNAENLCNLAVTSILGGDLDAASAAVEKSMKLNPNDPIARAVASRIAKYRGGAKLPRTIRELERG